MFFGHRFHDIITNKFSQQMFYYKCSPSAVRHESIWHKQAFSSLQKYRKNM